MNKAQLIVGVACLVIAVAAFTTFQGYPILNELLQQGTAAIEPGGWSDPYEPHLTALLGFICCVVVTLSGVILVSHAYITRERPTRAPRPTRPTRQPHLRLV